MSMNRVVTEIWLLFDIFKRSRIILRSSVQGVNKVCSHFSFNIASFVLQMFHFLFTFLCIRCCFYFHKWLRHHWISLKLIISNFTLFLKLCFFLKYKIKGGARKWYAEFVRNWRFFKECFVHSVFCHKFLR